MTTATQTQSPALATIRNYSKRAHKTARVLNKRFTIRVMDLLRESPKNVTQLMIKLRCDQCVLSERLARMRQLDLVYTERAGKYIYYHINTDRMDRIAKAVSNFVNGNN